MASHKTIVISDRHNFNLNLFNLVVFVLAALTGSLLQIQYHIHGWPANWPVIGLSKSGWVLIHKVSAVLFLSGIAAHCLLNGRFVSALTRRLLNRRLSPLSSLSYDVFLISLPTLMTALVSWWFFEVNHPVRHVLVEIHDKLGWVQAVFICLHIVLRSGRMVKVYRKLSGERVAQ